MKAISILSIVLLLATTNAYMLQMNTEVKTIDPAVETCLVRDIGALIVDLEDIVQKKDWAQIPHLIYDLYQAYEDCKGLVTPAMLGRMMSYVKLSQATNTCQDLLQQLVSSIYAGVHRIVQGNCDMDCLKGLLSTLKKDYSDAMTACLG